jgi:hypothetical protein
MNKKPTYNIIKLTAIILAPLSPIIIACIQFHPWSNSILNSQKDKKHEYYLAGTVVDETTNESISQAEVTVVGRNEQYITESNGNFRIPFKDSVGYVRIRIEKKNFRTIDKSYNLPTEDIEIQLSHK